MRRMILVLLCASCIALESSNTLDRAWMLADMGRGHAQAAERLFLPRRLISTSVALVVPYDLALELLAETRILAEALELNAFMLEREREPLPLPDAPTPAVPDFVPESMPECEK